MSVQPPWPGRPGSESEPNPSQGQASQGDGWAQLGQDQQQPYGQQPQNGQYEQGQPYLQQQPHYGQQHYGQQPAAAPYGQQPAPPPYAQQYNGQPYYGAPNGAPNGMAPKKKTALPWILAGGGVLVLAAVVIVVVVVSGLLTGGNKGSMVDAPITSASFQYPEGWIRMGANVTIIKDDGSSPAEHFNAANHTDTPPSAMVVYQAGEKPTGNVTTEKIKSAIDQGLAGQLAASQEDLVYFRSTSGFGCLKDFAYTVKPVIVERDGLYGYSYGYTCSSYQRKITGEYLVAYDTTGISHRLTVEAVDAEWAKNGATLTAIVDSLKPAL